MYVLRCFLIALLFQYLCKAATTPFRNNDTNQQQPAGFITQEDVDPFSSPEDRWIFLTSKNRWIPMRTTPLPATYYDIRLKRIMQALVALDPQLVQKIHEEQQLKESKALSAEVETGTKLTTTNNNITK